MVHDMCEQHADTVTAPLGWQVRDLRDPAIMRNDADSEAESRRVRFDLIGA